MIQQFLFTCYFTFSLFNQSLQVTALERFRKIQKKKFTKKFTKFKVQAQFSKNKGKLPAVPKCPQILDFNGKTATRTVSQLETVTLYHNNNQSCQAAATAAASSTPSTTTKTYQAPEPGVTPEIAAYRKGWIAEPPAQPMLSQQAAASSSMMTSPVPGYTTTTSTSQVLVNGQLPFKNPNGSSLYTTDTLKHCKKPPGTCRWCHCPSGDPSSVPPDNSFTTYPLDSQMFLIHKRGKPMFLKKADLIREFFPNSYKGNEADLKKLNAKIIRAQERAKLGLGGNYDNIQKSKQAWREFVQNIIAPRHFDGCVAAAIAHLPEKQVEKFLQLSEADSVKDINSCQVQNLCLSNGASSGTTMGPGPSTFLQLSLQASSTSQVPDSVPKEPMKPLGTSSNRTKKLSINPEPINLINDSRSDSDISATTVSASDSQRSAKSFFSEFSSVFSIGHTSSSSGNSLEMLGSEILDTLYTNLQSKTGLKNLSKQDAAAVVQANGISTNSLTIISRVQSVALPTMEEIKTYGKFMQLADDGPDGLEQTWTAMKFHAHSLLGEEHDRLKYEVGWRLERELEVMEEDLVNNEILLKNTLNKVEKELKVLQLGQRERVKQVMDQSRDSVTEVSDPHFTNLNRDKNSKKKKAEIRNKKAEIKENAAQIEKMVSLQHSPMVYLTMATVMLRILGEKAHLVRGNDDKLEALYESEGDDHGGNNKECKNGGKNLKGPSKNISGNGGNYNKGGQKQKCRSQELEETSDTEDLIYSYIESESRHNTKSSFTSDFNLELRQRLELDKQLDFLKVRKPSTIGPVAGDSSKAQKPESDDIDHADEKNDQHIHFVYQTDWLLKTLDEAKNFFGQEVTPIFSKFGTKLSRRELVRILASMKYKSPENFRVRMHFEPFNLNENKFVEDSGINFKNSNVYLHRHLKMTPADLFDGKQYLVFKELKQYYNSETGLKDSREWEVEWNAVHNSSEKVRLSVDEDVFNTRLRIVDGSVKITHVKKKKVHVKSDSRIASFLALSSPDAGTDANVESPPSRSRVRRSASNLLDYYSKSLNLSDSDSENFSNSATAGIGGNLRDSSTSRNFRESLEWIELTPPITLYSKNTTSTDKDSEITNIVNYQQDERWLEPKEPDHGESHHIFTSSQLNHLRSKMCESLATFLNKMGVLIKYGVKNGRVPVLRQPFPEPEESARELKRQDALFADQVVDSLLKYRDDKSEIIDLSTDKTSTVTTKSSTNTISSIDPNNDLELQISPTADLNQISTAVIETLQETAVQLQTEIDINNKLHYTQTDDDFDDDKLSVHSLGAESHLSTVALSEKSLGLDLDNKSEISYAETTSAMNGDPQVVIDLKKMWEDRFQTLRTELDQYLCVDNYMSGVGLEWERLKFRFKDYDKTVGKRETVASVTTPFNPERSERKLQKFLVDFMGFDDINKMQSREHVNGTRLGKFHKFTIIKPEPMKTVSTDMILKELLGLLGVENKFIDELEVRFEEALVDNINIKDKKWQSVSQQLIEVINVKIIRSQAVIEFQMTQKNWNNLVRESKKIKFLEYQPPTDSCGNPKTSDEEDRRLLRKGLEAVLQENHSVLFKNLWKKKVLGYNRLFEIVYKKNSLLTNGFTETEIKNRMKKLGLESDRQEAVKDLVRSYYYKNWPGSSSTVTDGLTSNSTLTKSESQESESLKFLKPTVTESRSTSHIKSSRKKDSLKSKSTESKSSKHQHTQLKPFKDVFGKTAIEYAYLKGAFEVARQLEEVISSTS